MSLTTKPLTRRFNYNGLQLPDPNPELDPNEIAKFFTGQYPELTNAVVDGPKVEGENLVYTFVRSIGQKG